MDLPLPRPKITNASKKVDMPALKKTGEAYATDEMAEVFGRIEESFNSFRSVGTEDIILGAFRHHFDNKGKATRATASLLASDALGICKEDAVAMAAAVETLHNASLIQDDFQDGTLTRRGAPSVHALYGADVALGLGTQLTSSAFASLCSAGFGSKIPDMIRRIHFAIGVTVSGQTSSSVSSTQHSVEELKCAARNKSGPLFALAVELPLIAAGYSSSLSKAHEAGCLFGLGYQILDDIKDREADALNPIDSNIVNALARSGIDTEAVSSAVLMAKTYLGRSSELFGELPCQCGGFLREYADRMIAASEASHV